MNQHTLARVRLDGAGWAHPYGHSPFAPFLYADGGDGSGDGSGAPAAAAGEAGQGTQQPLHQAVQQAMQPPAQPAANPWDGFQWDGNVDSLPDPVAKIIREAREEAGKSRTVAKQNAATEAREELLATISKAVGMDTGDTPPTPEQLTQQLMESHVELSSAQERATSAAIELHVYKAATRLGVNADALLDSRAFCDAIDNIDAAADPAAFNSAVEHAINAALGQNPNLRAQLSAASGGDLSGGTGEGSARQRPTSLTAAVRGALGT
ncbi:hypothetical protein ABT024_06875 [Streptomyces sp. NPDC002812]|uniref:hypothetical protein n=1 Tax=Streptomyces sp. NPDC002812 TaxID=3154434 RepID=UPI003321E026